jgi:toxin ParE1/3/4
MELRYSLRARKQLLDLEKYLAERFYPRSAERFLNRLTAACERLTLAPSHGTTRDDLRAGVRSTGFEKLVVIYFEVTEDNLLVLSILYRGKMPAPPDLHSRG